MLLNQQTHLSPRFSFEVSNNFSYSNNPPSEIVPGNSLAQQFVQVDPDIQDEIVRLLFADFNWPGGEFDSSNPGHILIGQGEIQTRYDAAPTSVQSQVDTLIIANTISRRNYFSDEIGITGHYEYFRDCLLSFGYTYSKDKNDASFLNESESHNPHVEVYHVFSEEFTLDTSYDFLKTNNEISDDSESHNFVVTPAYRFNQANRVSGAYDYEHLTYSGDQGGHDINRLTFDFEHKYSAKTTINFSTSPYYIDSETVSSERGYSFDVDFSQEIMRGNFSVNAGRTIAENKIVGDWQDLRKSWLIRPSLQYELIENLESDTYLSYELRQNWLAGVETKYHDYGAGVTFSYPLSQFFTGHLEYSYKQLDSDNIFVEDYNENRVVFKISATNELWRN